MRLKTPTNHGTARMQSAIFPTRHTGQALSLGIHENQWPPMKFPVKNSASALYQLPNPNVCKTPHQPRFPQRVLRSSKPELELLAGPPVGRKRSLSVVAVFFVS